MSRPIKAEYKRQAIDLTSMDESEDRVKPESQVKNESSVSFPVIATPSDITHPDHVAFEITQRIEELYKNQFFTYSRATQQAEISKLLKLAIPKMLATRDRASLNDCAAPFNVYCMELSAKLLNETGTSWFTKMLYEFRSFYFGHYRAWYGAPEEHPDRKDASYHEEVRKHHENFATIQANQKPGQLYDVFAH